jgi:hypothetical protein
MTREDRGTSNIFLNKPPVSQKMKARTDKWNCIKLKSVYIVKATISRMKRQPTEWEKIFANYSSKD